jgi:hypothetical protein
MSSGPSPKWSTIVVAGLMAAAALSVIATISNRSGVRPTPPTAPFHDAAYKAEVAANLAAIHPGTGDHNWEYSAETGALGVRVLMACVDSSTSASLHWPYHDTKARLCLRQRGSHHDFYLYTTEKSQMLCSSYEGCSVPVRYDSEPASKLTLYEPSDYDSSYLIAKVIPKRMLAARQTVIAPTFYQDGQQEFVFDTHSVDLAKLGYAPSFTESARPSKAARRKR